MIELKKNTLKFSFPEIHKDANFNLTFQRTFRIPDDGTEYPLPPGFGNFPLEHVDDFAGTVPANWLERGGVMLPMFQSEAMWIDFSRTSHHGYPFAVKIAAGKINAVSGDPWQEGLRVRPMQDYLPVPEQPWLDGFSVGEGLIICDYMSLGMAPGGKIRQEIFEDEFEESGLPWFQYYGEEAIALEGSAKLAGLRSVAEADNSYKSQALPENESVVPGEIVNLRRELGKWQVREV